MIARLCRICYKYCGIRRYRLALVSLQIADLLSAEIFEKSVWKCAAQIPLRVLQWFSKSWLSCSIVRQNQPSFTFLLYYWPIIAIKLYSISFFISGILLQQPRAPLEGVSAYFSNMYCIILKEMRYSIFLGRRHNSCWTHSPQTPSCNKNGGFLVRSYFRDFVRTQKIEDLSESKKLFRRSISNKSRFVVAKKNFGG